MGVTETRLLAHTDTETQRLKQAHTPIREQHFFPILNANVCEGEQCEFFRYHKALVRSCKLPNACLLILEGSAFLLDGM